MIRPVLVLRRARTSVSLFALLVGAAVLATVLPAPGTVGLGRLRAVAMSDQTMTNRAEHHPYYARKLGRRMARDHGWRSDRQWHCLRRLWNMESSWRVHADNPSSSAYGIPQALPGRKMSSAGGHWRRNAGTQIRWGIRYVNSRYDAPCAAMRHKQRHGWY
ncbi:MAG TPA: hypothetical protein VH274_02150 [Mycobacteriales bacterium]|nr:hypothetical protein [Mycobacteriales bacterium]